MSEFEPKAAAFDGRLVIRGSLEEVFSLFSPKGEQLWISDWEPELLHPPGIDWCQGQIFRTKEELGEAVWIVSELDLTSHGVEYHRFERERYVAQIRVSCRPVDDGTIEVATSYSFIGLSESGNREIGLMTQNDYDAKMNRWAEWIKSYLASREGESRD